MSRIVVSEPSKNMGKSAAFVHHMYCPASMDSVKAIAKICFTEEHGNRDGFYLIKIETVSTDSIGFGKSSVQPSSADTVGWNIAQIFEFVKNNMGVSGRGSKSLRYNFLDNGSGSCAKNYVNQKGFNALANKNGLFRCFLFHTLDLLR